ncbi:MAG: GNAT family N-acetyltransferase [Cellvibrionaceae bacterium]
MLTINAIKSQFPFIISESDLSLQLSIFTKDDIQDDYVNWLNDPDIVKFSDQRFKQHSFESCVDYLDSIASTENLLIAIKDSQTDQLLGTTGVSLNRYHSVADIGLLIGKDNWGRGIGLAVWRTLMLFLLEKCSVRKVTGGTLSCNLPMIKIMQNAGMEADGIRHQHQQVDGIAYDIVHFYSLITTIRNETI